MNSHEQPPMSEPLRSTAIPIVQIFPEADRILERSIHAVVTLVWPYSSSNKSLSLLLAEPDFRLRRNNGQVKVVFCGRAAEAVAKSQVGIGDHVYLGLAGSKFVPSEAVAQTPGKCVPWDVQLDDRVLLEIWRSSQHFSTVKLDPSTVPTQNIEDAIAPPATPIANGLVERGEATSTATFEAWRSPAFVERTRTSFGGLVDSAYDPFAEEDGFVPGKGRKRPRFSFRGADWRVIDEPASPGEKEVPADWTWMFEEDETHESNIGEENHIDSATLPQEIPTATATEPNAPEGVDTVADVDHEPLDVDLMNTERMAEQPTRPSPEFAQPLRAPGFPQHFSRQQFAGSDFQYPTDTPRLYPIPSPGLPIPSPLVTRSGSAHDYFPPVAPNVQTPLDQSAADGEEVEMTEENIVISRVQPDVPTRQELQPLVTTPQQAILGNKSVLASQNPPIEFEAQGQRDMKDTSAADAIPLEDREPAQHHEDVEKGISDVPPVSLDQSYAEKPAEVASRDIRDVVEEESEQSDINQEREVQDEENNEDSEDELEEQSEVELEEESVEDESAEEEDELVDEYGYEDVQEQRSQRPPDAFGANGFHQDGTRRYEDSEVEEIAIGTNKVLEDDDVSDTGSEALSVAERQAAEDKSHPHNLEEESDEDKHEGDYEDEGTFDEEDIEGGDERVEVLDEEEDEDEEDAEEQELEDEDKDEDEEESVLEDEQEAYEDDYDRVDSESESYAGADSAARPEKVVHPEIIVLDSDSEDEAVVSAPTEAHMPSAEYAATVNDVESSATSGDEDDVSDRSSVGSEAEEWPEDELAEDDQTGDDEAEEESMQDEIAVRDDAEDELMEDAPSEEDSVAEEPMEVHADAGENSALASPVQSEVQHEADVENDLISETPNEVLQATPGAPQSPEGQDIADLPISVAQSAQGPHPDSVSGPWPRDLALDPELYRLGGTGEDETRSPETDAHAEAGPEKPGLEDEGIREPFFDGAASPQPVDSSTELASPVQEPSPQAPQLVTPDASQLTAPSHHLRTAIPIGDFLPTPEQTQEVAQGLSTQYDGHADAPGQTVLHISNTSVETGVSSTTEYNVQMSSTLAEQQRQTQTDGPVHDEEYAMSSVGDEIPSEVHDWGVSAQSLERMSSAVNRDHPGLRSKYSYFAPLATLIDHYNSLIDTISVVSEVSPVSRATTGKKDFTLSLQVTDPSMAGTIVHAQIFRPYKSALPSVKEGDAILLRNFQVKSFNHSMMLVSVDTSAWAVFHNASKEAQIAGPPVEYGDEETAYATDLRQWYHEVGIAMVADYQLQASVLTASREATPVSSVAHSDAGSVDSASREVRGESSVSNRGSKRRKSHRRITIHELRDGRRYAEVGSPSDKESIHELRDGTLYANL